MVIGDLHASLSGLVSPPGRLEEVHRREILIPLSLSFEEASCKGEAGQLVLHPRPAHQQSECCPTGPRNSSDYCYEHLACPDLFFFISLSNSLVNNLADCLLVDMSWPEQVPGTLRLVNLHFGRDIGDGRLCNEVPLI